MQNTALGQRQVRELASLPSFAAFAIGVVGVEKCNRRTTGPSPFGQVRGSANNNRQHWRSKIKPNTMNEGDALA
jgi:hypothetical protein